MTNYNKAQKKIILASASPRRKRLLEQLGLLVEVIPSDYHEGEPQDPIEHFVLDTAKQKAQVVINKMNCKQELVVAADTLVVIGQYCLGKPKNQEEARQMLIQLSGQTHRVLTGVFVSDCSTGRYEYWVEETKVIMRKLSKQELDAYIVSQAWEGKAGGYGIQNAAAAFIPRIEGCYFNVVGLPLARLYETLNQLGLYL